MKHIHLLLIGAVILSMGPIQKAEAYETPESTLHAAPTQVYVSPSTRRARAEQQAQDDAERIQRLWEAQFGTDAEPVTVDPTDPFHGSADPEPTDDNVIRLELSNADFRKLQRLLAIGEDNNLHSGAPLDEMPTWSGKPLTPTGPAGPLTAIAILGAMVWTLKRATSKA